MDLSAPFNTVRFQTRRSLIMRPLHLRHGVLRDSGMHLYGTIFQKSVQLLAYADDIDIIERNKRDVTAALVLSHGSLIRWVW